MENITNKEIKYPKEFLKAIKQLKKEGIIKETKKNTYKLVKKYSQDDVEFMVDWFNCLNQLNTGIVSEDIQKAFKKADKIRINLHQKVFLDNLNWKLSFNKKHKLVVKYNDR